MTSTRQPVNTYNASISLCLCYPNIAPVLLAGVLPNPLNSFVALRPQHLNTFHDYSYRF